MGVFQILFGVFKLGKFVRLIPHPVMLGFVNGLAIIIFKAQFSQFYVGVGDSRHLMELVPFVVMVLLILVTMFISYYLPKITKAVPGTLVAILVVTGASLFLKEMGFKIFTVIDFVQNMDPSKTTIAASLPQFQPLLLSFDAIKIVFP